MKEQDWLKFASLSGMLSHLASTKQKISGRKFRLLGCACCRLRWSRLKDARSQQAVATAEKFVDKQASRRELQEAHQAAQQVRGAQSRTLAALAVDVTMSRAGSLTNAVPQSLQCQLLHEIVGNPFRKVTIDPAWLKWRDHTVRNLAEAAYDKRELPSGHLSSVRLAFLADALEEAGCTSEELLKHLRGPGPHVLGCWAVDLLLDKK